MKAIPAFSNLRQFLRKLSLQAYINAIIISIGLLADLISLGVFFGAIHSPQSGSNFYVNNREYLAWVLLAIIYSMGIVNAYIRRRWRRLYGNNEDHSIWNMFALFYIYGADSSIKLQNFKRDFSFLYVVMLPITFLYARAVSATITSTGVTESPWGDILVSAFVTIPVAIGMMVITTMFDFAFSMFSGNQVSEQPQNS